MAKNQEPRLAKKVHGFFSTKALRDFPPPELIVDAEVNYDQELKGRDGRQAIQSNGFRRKRLETQVPPV